MAGSEVWKRVSDCFSREAWLIKGSHDGIRRLLGKFRKVKVALNPIYRMFLNFAKIASDNAYGVFAQVKKL